MKSTAIDQFRISPRGELIQEHGEGYDAARKVHDDMIDRRPQLIVRCSDVTAIINAVKYAKENNYLAPNLQEKTWKSDKMNVDCFNHLVRWDVDFRCRLEQRKRFMRLFGRARLNVIWD